MFDLLITSLVPNTLTEFRVYKAAIICSFKNVIFLPQIARSLSMSIIKWVKFHTISIKIVTGMFWYLINLHIHIGKTWIFKFQNIRTDGWTHEFEVCLRFWFLLIPSLNSWPFTFLCPPNSDADLPIVGGKTPFINPLGPSVFQIDLYEFISNMKPKVWNVLIIVMVSLRLF